MINPPASFFEEETRLGHTISSQMKHVWAIQLDMAQRIIEVCQKHNIHIFADSGTALGAVRHQGYIPWDDDIDFIMLRSEYEKLIAVASQEFRSPYHFQTAYTDKNYQRGHAQLRYDGTSAILHSEFAKGRNVEYHLGVFVDIFVLDGVEENDKSFCRRQKRYNRLRTLMRHRAAIDELNRPSIKNLLIGNALKICGLSVPKLFSRSEKILKNVSNNTQMVRALGISFTKRTSCRERQLYDETVYLPFEYIQVPLVRNYHQYLSTVFGSDYMTPKKIATMHGSFAVLDAKKDFKEYLAERNS